MWSEASTFFPCLCVLFTSWLLGFLGRFLQVKRSLRPRLKLPCVHLTTRLRTSPFFWLCRPVCPVCCWRADLRATGRNLAVGPTWMQPEPAISPGAASSFPELRRGSGKILRVSYNGRCECSEIVFGRAKYEVLQRLDLCWWCKNPQNSRQDQAGTLIDNAHLSQTRGSVVSDLIVEQREKNQSTIQPQSLRGRKKVSFGRRGWIIPKKNAASTRVVPWLCTPHLHHQLN